MMDTAKHFNFGYAFGSHLHSNILEGMGKNMRHIKIRTLKDLREKESEIVGLLQEAAKL